MTRQWRGPEYDGEFPSLGWQVGEWIEAHLVIPDGYRQGHPYLLTEEMWRFLAHRYRVHEDAQPEPSAHALVYYGAQLRRSQKWGKDPLGAALQWAEALGPTRFDGWDANGEPVGKPYPSPLIVLLGTSEDQTANTWRPIKSMGRNGPLADMRGLDIGETKVVLPGGGIIEPVTTSAKARLGAPITSACITESHLFALQGGYRRVVDAVKRNLAGMDGRWIELTNAWDPTEASAAQATVESSAPGVYIDTIEPHRVADLDDDAELRRELLRQYGDSAAERGGWVNLTRIMADVRDPSHLEADRRRFFLNEIVVGMSVFADPVRWDAQARTDLALAPGDAITLGFDGAKYQDATALIACRIADGALFELGVWERPPNAPRDWQVDRTAVDDRVHATFDAYRVALMYADPWRWQDYQDQWAGEWPDRVVEFQTNREQLMDRAIERFMTAQSGVDFAHDGAPTLARHVKNTVVTKGGRKRGRPGEDAVATHYLRLAKRGAGQLIDAAVAAVLAYEARAYAIEHNLAPSDEDMAAPAAWFM